MTPAVHEPRRPATHRLALWFARPKVLAIGCLALLAGLGWVYLGLMLAGMGFAIPQAPGAGQPIVDTLADRMGLGGWGRIVLEALCRPTFGVAATGDTSLAGIAAVTLMWGAMVLAMMVGAIRTDLASLSGATAAVLGGIVLLGSNRSTADQALARMRKAEAARAALIDRLELQPVGNGRGVPSA